MTWLRDWWRIILIAFAAVLVGLLVVLVVTSVTDRENALQLAKQATVNQQNERATLNQRISQLLAQVDQLEHGSQAAAGQLAVLRQEILLLQQQVRDLGGQPVTDSGGAGQESSGAASASPTPRPTSHPSPSRSPSPTPKPSPSPTCVRAVLTICT